MAEKKDTDKAAPAQESARSGNWWTRMSITQQIVVAMLGGGFLGAALNVLLGYDMDGKLPADATGLAALTDSFLVEGVFYVGGQIFIRGLKLLVVPLVFCSLVCGVALLSGNVGRVGGRTIGLYLLTTALAISLALVMAFLVDPGAGVQIGAAAAFAPPPPPSFVEVLVDVFPSNPIEAMAEGKMLQIIVFALLFGFILNRLGKKVQAVYDAMGQLNDIFINMVLFIVKFAPYGVFCLIGHVFASKGIGVFLNLAQYFFLVLGVLVLHGLVVYSSMLYWLGGLSPMTFFLQIRQVLLVGFSTSSSNATLPVTLRTLNQRLGVDPAVSSFTAPLGATINMDGTSIMMGTATVFIASAYGLELSVADYLLVILTASLASIGTAGVPSAGLIMLALVLEQAGLPVEGIGLILGVDRLLDMARTAVNVSGDCAVTCIVAKGEGQLDEAVFNNVSLGQTVLRT